MAKHSEELVETVEVSMNQTISYADSLYIHSKDEYNRQLIAYTRYIRDLSETIPSITNSNRLEFDFIDHLSIFLKHHISGIWYSSDGKKRCAEGWDGKGGSVTSHALGLATNAEIEWYVRYIKESMRNPTNFPYLFQDESLQRLFEKSLYVLNAIRNYINSIDKCQECLTEYYRRTRNTCASSVHWAKN